MNQRKTTGTPQKRDLKDEVNHEDPQFSIEKHREAQKTSGSSGYGTHQYIDMDTGRAIVEVRGRIGHIMYVGSSRSHGTVAPAVALSVFPGWCLNCILHSSPIDSRSTKSVKALVKWRGEILGLRTDSKTSVLKLTSRRTRPSLLMSIGNRYESSEYTAVPPPCSGIGSPGKRLPTRIRRLQGFIDIFVR